MTTITIGLPIYNSSLYLGDTIQSIINQSFTDWELWVVDDGSTDSSVSIAQSFTDSRIKVIADGKNKGQSARLNQICQMAVGKYVARMDADDIMTVDRLQTQCDFLKDHPRVDVISSFAYSIDIHNKIKGMRKASRMPETLQEAVRGFPIVHPTVMARREWFLANPYNEQLLRVQDYELWLRTMSTSTFAVIERPLLFYREIGLPYRNKYLRSSAEIRSVLRQQYRHQLGRKKLYQVMATTARNDALYSIFNLFKSEDQLLLRRSQRLDREKQIIAQKLLDQAIIK
ncbi:glycosyltransferase family 2 protein [Larkinella insperata]|uniref:Glycosyltransferase family 2 protein n=1 Tax=Larkinella insperata TaxID=332158 RepID=A0ABW3QBA9_9BACT|nr:glycosyltransferase [Larkinella insperata]